MDVLLLSSLGLRRVHQAPCPSTAIVCRWCKPLHLATADACRRKYHQHASRSFAITASACVCASDCWALPRAPSSLSPNPLSFT